VGLVASSQGRACLVADELNVAQEGIPEAIPPNLLCYLGWQESLMLLVNLVEAEIPD
jgi:hypothetical protein